MDLLTNYIPQQVINALGWTVLHSLWQAIVVSTIVGIALLLMKKRSSNERYLMANAGLVAIFIWAVFTFLQMLDKELPVAASISGLYYGGTSEPTIQQELRAFFTGYIEMNMPFIVAIWLIGEFLFMLKLAGGLLYVQRLQHFNSKPLERIWQDRLNVLSKRLGLKRVISLSESTLVKTPVVIGWLKPVILMPVGAINNISAQQAEAILAHELAHIRRHDYLLNLIQSVIETFLYFNPAVWWLSAQIRTERENSCDDIAVSLVGDSLLYAKALAALQEMNYTAPAFAIPFSENRNQLLNRIKRILSQQQNKSNVMEKLSATLILLLTMWLLSANANSPLGQTWENLLTKKSESPVSDDFKNNVYATRLITVSLDTVPAETKKEVITKVQKSGEEEIELSVVNGKIESLKINGREIPKEEFGNYQHLLEDINKERIAPPPPPPPPPAPVFRERVIVPAPPSPPSPAESRKITTERDGKKTTIIVESAKEAEPIKIVVESGKKGSVIINGQEIKELKDGNKTIIIEKPSSTSRAPWIYSPRLEGEYRVEVRPENRFSYRYRFDSRDSTSAEPKMFFFDGDAMLMMPKVEALIDGQHLKLLHERMDKGNFKLKWNQELLDDKGNILHLDLKREELEKMREELRKNADKMRSEQEIIIRQYLKSAEELQREMKELHKEHNDEIKKEIEIEKTRKKKIN